MAVPKTIKIKLRRAKQVHLSQTIITISSFISAKIYITLHKECNCIKTIPRQYFRNVRTQSMENGVKIAATKRCVGGFKKMLLWNFKVIRFYYTANDSRMGSYAVKFYYKISRHFLCTIDNTSGINSHTRGM